MLTRKQLQSLRKQVVLNSLYYSDYSNDLYISEKTCYNFFDSYVEYLYELASENNDNDLDIVDVVKKYDNINNLYNWYLCYGDDPLIKDDFIGIYNDSVYTGVVIYDFKYDYDDYAITSYLYCSGIARITKNKLYYGSKRDDYYFIKNHRRYYIKDFNRVNR